jgi:class 3 adenylate cyclase
MTISLRAVFVLLVFIVAIVASTIGFVPVYLAGVQSVLATAAYLRVELMGHLKEEVTSLYRAASDTLCVMDAALQLGVAGTTNATAWGVVACVSAKRLRGLVSIALTDDTLVSCGFTGAAVIAGGGVAASTRWGGINGSNTTVWSAPYAASTGAAVALTVSSPLMNDGVRVAAAAVEVMQPRLPNRRVSAVINVATREVIGCSWETLAAPKKMADVSNPLWNYVFAELGDDVVLNGAGAAGHDGGGSGKEGRQYSVKDPESESFENILVDVGDIDDAKSGLSLRVVVLIREDDFVNSMNETTLQSIVWAGISMGCLMLLAALVAYFLLQPLRQLERRMYASANFEVVGDDGGGGQVDYDDDSFLTEVFNLQVAHDAMRQQLAMVKSYLPMHILNQINGGCDSSDYDEGDIVTTDDDLDDSMRMSSVTTDAVGARQGERMNLIMHSQLSNSLDLENFAVQPTPLATPTHSFNNSHTSQLSVASTGSGEKRVVSSSLSNQSANQAPVRAKPAWGVASATPEHNSSDTDQSLNGTMQRSSTQMSMQPQTSVTLAPGGAGPGGEVRGPRLKRLKSAMSTVRMLSVATSLSQRNVSVLVVNLRGFHRTFALHGAEEAVLLQREMLAAVERVSRANKGVVDYFFGDHVVVSYNASQTTSSHTMKCATAMLQLQAACCDLAQRPAFNGLNCGMATGSAFVGNMGTAFTKHYCSVGPVVNRAMILERLCKPLGVATLLTNQAARVIENEIFYRHVDVVRLPGIVGATCVSTLVGAKAQRDGEEWMYAMARNEATDVDASRNAAFDAFAGGDAAAATTMVDHIPAAAVVGAEHARLMGMLEQDTESYATQRTRELCEVGYAFLSPH